MSKYLETMPESLEDKIKKIFGETVAKEGNKFTKALMAARENGKKFFSVNGRQYETEAYKEDNTNDKSDDGEGMDKVQPKAVKKKFADRKDKDIDNDGDTDSSDKYLHKRRKAISKATSEEVEPCGLTAEACWDSHKQVGTKMKGGKQVPNCVPKNEAVTQDDHGEKINQDKKDAAMKKTDQKKSFDQLRKEQKLVKAGDKGKTATGKDVAMIDVEPSSRPI